jgi:citronellol/citronellal dehydrogenase
MGEALLREGLLEGLRALVATGAGGQGDATVAGAVERRLATLGASVATCELAPRSAAAEEQELEALITGALASLGGADLLVLDGPALFEAAGQAPLLGSMQSIWELARAVAGATMLEAQGGLLVLIAPAPGAGEHAEAARAGLENLARTLSIEWARFRTRAVTVAPGDATSPAELAELVAYLASPAGAYFSGCQLDLRGP